VKSLSIPCICLLAVYTSACETKTQTGALTGAGVGALAGGLIGGNAAGAIIGGAVGAAGGALIGAALDAQDRNKLEQNAPSTLQKIDQQQALSVSDIKAMTQSGLSDDVIIAQIDATHSTFVLSSEQIIELKEVGVSQRVIEHMIRTG